MKDFYCLMLMAITIRICTWLVAVLNMNQGPHFISTGSSGTMAMASLNLTLTLCLK